MGSQRKFQAQGENRFIKFTPRKQSFNIGEFYLRNAKDFSWFPTWL
jgi:hypothetical protein